MPTQTPDKPRLVSLLGTNRIDHWCFWPALILAPIAVAILGVIIAAISTGFVFESGDRFLYYFPVFAVVFGAIPYLLLGTPAFWLVLKIVAHPWGRVAALMLAGFLVNFLSGPLLAIAFGGPIGSSGGVTQFGMIFAPLWAGAMGLIYNVLSRFKRHMAEVTASSEGLPATSKGPNP
ncbi:MAG: hypothetical protein AAGB16_08560 [Pseudomonadota bacterium]